ncbi:hypothetical protein N7931_10675 [Catenovulum sp. 2E275]|uniref:hypothetical protein n=1 Tax=Catenovulum sp. 2E275 TaxID=2980497 RepID=UPI0021D32A98|nr:hypothetical protein [Catenovulum sp. 2E275]MCU4676098.1 hypothetical protein [Catenovulum sp. 2E275]
MSDNDKRLADEQWCHRAETANLLALSIAQIHMSLTEGDNSINTLTDSFQKLAGFCAQVESLTQSEQSQDYTRVSELASNMSVQVTNAIVAFQFYDRLCQRLEHVTTSLNGLADLLKDDAQLTKAKGWQELRETIRKQYTMQAEHEMFELIMSGHAPEEALIQYKQKLLESQESDDIELF